APFLRITAATEHLMFCSCCEAGMWQRAEPPERSSRWRISVGVFYTFPEVDGPLDLVEAEREVSGSPALVLELGVGGDLFVPCGGRPRLDRSDEGASHPVATHPGIHPPAFDVGDFPRLATFRMGANGELEKTYQLAVRQLGDPDLFTRRAGSQEGVDLRGVFGDGPFRPERPPHPQPLIAISGIERADLQDLWWHCSRGDRWPPAPPAGARTHARI